MCYPDHDRAKREVSCGSRGAECPMSTYGSLLAGGRWNQGDPVNAIQKSGFRWEIFWPVGLWRISRSEEHTSELQSLMRISYAVFCLKKKTNTNTNINIVCIYMHHNVTDHHVRNTLPHRI